MAKLFGNHIETPSQAFVNEFLKITGIYLMASNAKFYDQILSAMYYRFVSDQVAIDKEFSKMDSEYNCTECKYKGKATSTNMYVKEKFGDRALQMLAYLTNCEFKKEFKQS